MDHWNNTYNPVHSNYNKGYKGKNLHHVSQSSSSSFSKSTNYKKLEHQEENLKIFFQNHCHFIAPIVCTKSPKTLYQWADLVESKFDVLIGYLNQNPHTLSAHIHYKQFDIDSKSVGEACEPYCLMWFIGIKFREKTHLDIDLKESIINFNELVIALAIENQLYEEGMLIEIRHVRRSQLSKYIDVDFLKPKKQMSSEEWSFSSDDSQPKPECSEESNKQEKNELESSVTVIAVNTAASSDESASVQNQEIIYENTSEDKESKNVTETNQCDSTKSQ